MVLFLKICANDDLSVIKASPKTKQLSKKKKPFGWMLKTSWFSQLLNIKLTCWSVTNMIKTQLMLQCSH